MSYLIDTDPGVDDALAIMYAMLSRLPMEGLTTVFGNVGVDQATINALTILELLQSDLPVAKGADHALRHIHCLAESHGYNGLSGFELHNLARVANTAPALDFIQESLSKGERSMICIGPTTNLALLCKADLAAAKTLKDVIILGGSFTGIGNTTAHAEFNVFSDPQALHDVLEAGLNPVIIPQEICERVVCTRSDFDRLGTGPLAENIRKIVDAYITYYEHEVRGPFEGGVMYDVLAVAYALLPQTFSLRPVCVNVNVESGELRGKTTIVEEAVSNARLVSDVDATTIRTTFLDVLCMGSARSVLH